MHSLWHGLPTVPPVPSLWHGLPTVPPVPTAGLRFEQPETFGRARWSGRETRQQHGETRPQRLAGHSELLRPPRIRVPYYGEDADRTDRTGPVPPRCRRCRRLRGAGITRLAVPTHARRRAGVDP